MKNNESDTKDLAQEIDAKERGGNTYSAPKPVKLGKAKTLTKGGIKDKKKDSWNELGFYV